MGPNGCARENKTGGHASIGSDSFSTSGRRHAWLKVLQPIRFNNQGYYKSLRSWRLRLQVKISLHLKLALNTWMKKLERKYGPWIKTRNPPIYIFSHLEFILRHISRCVVMIVLMNRHYRYRGPCTEYRTVSSGTLEVPWDAPPYHTAVCPT